MRTICIQALRDDRGSLTFEWTLLVTLLAIGITGGLTAARDGILDELGDVAQRMVALDGSYTISQPLEVFIDPFGGGMPFSTGGASNSGFQDAGIFTDCARQGVTADQPGLSDDPS